METSELVIKNNDCAIEMFQNTDMPELKQKTDVKLQTLPLKGTSLRKCGSDKEPFLANDAKGQ